MSVDTRPTVDAPDDDPWLWLEEVEGARASAWVERQNARTLAAFGGPQVEADATTLAAILDRPDKIPFIGRRRPAGSTTSGPTRRIRAASGGAPRRRASAATTPDWEVLIDLDALAIAEGEDWIWGGAGTRPGKARPRDRAAVARRQRCGRVARVRSRHEVVRGRWLRPARGQGQRGLGRRRHLAAEQRFRRRRHHLGLCPHRAAVAARREARGGAGPVRGAGQEHVGVLRDRPHRSRAADRGSTMRSASSTSRSGARRCGSTCRPPCRPTSITAGSSSSRATPGRSAARPGRATACSASGSTPSSPAAAISRCCSSPASGAS